MNVTKTERKESTKHCCGSGCRQRDSAEHKEEGGALIGQRITENNVTNADRNVNSLLERIVSPENLNQAYKRVVRNKGAGGVDGMKVGELLQYLKDNGGEKRAVLAGKYKPAPVRRVEIPKENGKKRMLGIPTAVDRVIQQAIAQVLTPIYEPEFVETSYGFRPGKSTHDAIRKCQEYLNEGYVWAVDMDLEKFFDTVNQSKLIEILPRKIKDGRVISLIHKYLRAGAVYCGKFEDTTIGVPQGGPLSPLCENIMLNELDHELKKRGHCYVRYADDMVILYRSKASAKQTLEHIIPYIERKLFLKVNQEKTVVAYAGKIKFLGYGFYKNQKGFQLRVHEKSKGKMKAKVKRLTGRRYVSDYEGFYIQMVWLNHPLPFGWTGSKPTVSLPHSLAALRIPFRYSVLILTSWTCYNSELRTDIPLILHFTSARRHDSVNFLVVFHELEKHMPAVSASNMCLDSAMDNSPTYRILKNRGIRAFIDLNHKCGQPKTFASGALSIKAYENGECVGQVRIPPSAGVNPEFLSEEQWGQVLEREGKLRAGK